MVRKSNYPINKLILNRWSPRAMSGDLISHQELMTLFEAARWAPSSYNNQPWRFVYAIRDSPYWKNFLDLLVPANKEWAKNAGALVVIISHNNFTYNSKPSRTHSFDAGAAWENLALQGYENGLVVHGMEGFDYDRAKKELAIPENYTIEAMCAIGKPGKKEVLPKEMQEKEIQSDRMPLESIVSEGTFNKN